MSESFYDDLEGLIGKHRAADSERAKQDETESRFKKIDERFDSLGKLIEERLPKKDPAAPKDEAEGSAGNGGGNSPAEENPPPTESEPEMNIEKVGHYTVPRIYQGEDEPDIVQYIDSETGETESRKGRRKGYPTNIQVENIMPEPENRPMEPESESA